MYVYDKMESFINSGHVLTSTMDSIPATELINCTHSLIGTCINGLVVYIIPQGMLIEQMS